MDKPKLTILTLKEVQSQIKMLEQEEKPVKRLLFSFATYFGAINKEYLEDYLQSFLLDLKQQEKELLPKQKYKQIEML